MHILSIIFLIGMIIGFLISEIYHHLKIEKELIETSPSFNRFNVDLGYLLIWSFAYIILIYFFNLDVIINLFIAIALIGYVFITDFYVYNKNETIHFKWVKNNVSLSFFLGGILILCFIFGFGLSLNIASAGIFEGSDWFTETFFSFLQNPSIVAIVSLMTIGGFMVIIAKTRRSGAFASVGYFLIMGLPIFTIFDTLLEIQFKAQAIYTAFGSEGLTVIIYTVIMLIFFILLTSVIVAMTSLIDVIRFDDD